MGEEWKNTHRPTQVAGQFIWGIRFSSKVIHFKFQPMFSLFWIFSYSEQQRNFMLTVQRCYKEGGRAGGKVFSWL